MAFRIAFGVASCRECETVREPVRSICKRVLEKVEHLKLLRYEQLTAFHEQEPEVETISGSEVVFTVYKQDMEAGKALVVVQAFYSTLWFPNYVSLGAVGKIYAEGITVDPTGTIADAPHRLLWEYR